MQKLLLFHFYISIIFLYDKTTSSPLSHGLFNTNLAIIMPWSPNVLKTCDVTTNPMRQSYRARGVIVLGTRNSKALKKWTKWPPETCYRVTLLYARCCKLFTIVLMKIRLVCIFFWLDFGVGSSCFERLAKRSLLLWAQSFSCFKKKVVFVYFMCITNVFFVQCNFSTGILRKTRNQTSWY